MKSGLPSEVEVIDALGDKITAGIARSVVRTRADLTDYRLQRPRWVADHSNRGLLNWISDRLWAHVVVEFDGLPDVDLVESGVTREMYVHGTFRFRFKKHDESGSIRSYPTQTALEFMVQEEGVLDGMEQIRLCAGFLWDAEAREMGQAVLSLRDGSDVESLVWMHHLDESAAGSGAVTTPIVPTSDPTMPYIESPVIKRREEPGSP